jgi:hypothetical protein
MGDFSYGAALSSGFRLIARKPLALLWWSAAFLVLIGLPVMLFVVYVLPSIIAAIQETVRTAGPPDPFRMMELQSRMIGWQPGIWLLQIVTQTLLMGAVFRGVLEPENSRWGYLRLSRQELWLGLTYLVISIMALIMAFLLFLPLGVGIGMAAAAAEHGGGVSPVAMVAICVSLLAGLGVMLWVLLRLSLALPMSFAQARFMIYESWDLTRGKALRMFLVYLVLALGLLAFELVVVGTLGVSLASRVRHVERLTAFLQDARTDMLQRWIPTILGFLVAVSVVGTAIRAIFIAPLAEIYRELTATAERKV